MVSSIRRVLLSVLLVAAAATLLAAPAVLAQGHDDHAGHDDHDDHGAMAATTGAAAEAHRDVVQLHLRGDADELTTERIAMLTNDLAALAKTVGGARASRFDVLLSCCSV
jgi:hypothetical protein